MGENKRGLKDIAKLFLNLDSIGFGSPAAHISMMREEVVIKRLFTDATMTINAKEKNGELVISNGSCRVQHEQLNSC